MPKYPVGRMYIFGQIPFFFLKYRFSFLWVGKLLFKSCSWPLQGEPPPKKRREVCFISCKICSSDSLDLHQVSIYTCIYWKCESSVLLKVYLWHRNRLLVLSCDLWLPKKKSRYKLWNEKWAQFRSEIVPQN